MAEQPVLVLGGGLAGIAAALHLAERRCPVVLLEKKAWLGGRASSFADAKTRDVIDNGQHVLLGCCTNMIDLLERIDRAGAVRWSKDFTYVEPGGRRHRLAPGLLPAPLHFSFSLMRFGALTALQRLEVVRAFVAMMHFSSAEKQRWQGESFLTWLKAHQQSEGTIHRFWHPIVIGAVNEAPDIAATVPAMQVFLEGFLAHRRASSLGVSQVSLQDLVGTAARTRLENLGCQVRTGELARRLVIKNNHVTGVELKRGDILPCSAVVVALPPPALQRLSADASQSLVPPHLIKRMRYAPIAGLHLWLDTEAVDLDQAALLDSRLEWIFNKGRPGPQARRLGAAQRLQGIISAAHALRGQSQGAILKAAMEELAAAFPKVREAKLIHGVVVQERQATLSLSPDVEALRPGQDTPCDNAFLAGDWLQTGWPGTLEGAVRSGRRAAAMVLQDNVQESLTPDLRPGPLARWLLRRVSLPLTEVDS